MIQNYLKNDSPIPYLAPFVVFMIFTSCESMIPEDHRQWYPLLYGVKILVTGLVMAMAFPVWKPYLKRLSRWAVPMGIAGGAIWIALCQLDGFGLKFLALSDGRAAFNPFAAFENAPLIAWTCWSVRMIGLVMIVPLIEEWFLRGFLLRFVCCKDWFDVKIGTVTPLVWGTAILYPILTHPEILPGIVWFTLITAMAAKTKSLTDCIVAHAITNLMLGIWVLLSHQWYLM